jgi:predicted nucleic acid-binding protein
VADRVIDAVISAEVVQEIFHRFLHVGRRDIAVEMANAALDLFAPVLPITDVIMRRVSGLAADHVGSSARDLVHAATCLVGNLEAIVSPDVAFDSVPGLARIAPGSLL